MIVFLLWVIVLILFWPIALALAVGALVYALVLAGLYLFVFSPVTSDVIPIQRNRTRSKL
jgi:hypothetical protein